MANSIGVADNGLQDRDNGLDIDFDCFLDQSVDVFKQDDAPEETLQAALMVVNIPNDKYRQEPRARNGSGAAHGNTRHVETAVHSPTEKESKAIGVVLKALNNLKSGMGTVRKILNIFDETKEADTVFPRLKSGYRASERQGKTKSRFAGAMVKGAKVPKQSTSSVPQPLTLQVLTIEQSDSDSEPSAQLAGFLQQHKYGVPDYIWELGPLG
jgi:hypothetical protein